MWLDVAELDRIEDKGFDEDELKGSLVFRQITVNERCPHCKECLERFQYRLNDLHLDFCPREHGYWLDAGEDTRIIGLMNEREEDVERKSDAEDEWHDTLEQMRSKSLVAKMEKHIRRRSFLYKIRNIEIRFAQTEGDNINSFGRQFAAFLRHRKRCRLFHLTDPVRKADGL